MRFPAQTLLPLALPLALAAGCAAPTERREHLDELCAIDRCELARRPDGELLALAGHEALEVRFRAVTALGRMPWPEHGEPVTRRLLATLGDPASEVRAAAAFALGQRGDPEAGDRLMALASGEPDPDPTVRARAVEAASRLDRPDLHWGILETFADPAAEVRIEAAVAPHRWSAEDEDAARVDAALVAVLGVEDDPEVRWRLLFSLQRRAAGDARDAFLEYSASDHVLERLFAVKGLARLEGDPKVAGALMRAADRGDWRVAVEALRGLVAYPEEVANAKGGLENLEVLSSHVVAELYPLLAEMTVLGGGAQTDWEISEEWLAEPSIEVRCARLPMAGYASWRALDFGWLDEVDEGSPFVRAAYARLLAADLDDNPAVEILGRIAKDPHPLTAAAALESLGKHPTPRSRAILHEYLHHEDMGRRLAAIGALAEMPDASDLDPLFWAYSSADGDVSAEVQFNALRLAGEIGGEDALDLLFLGLGNPDPWVHRVAHEELAEHFPDFEIPEDAGAHGAHPSARGEFHYLGSVPDGNPWVEIVTGRGSMVFELFARETPVHVNNFLTQAGRGHYDGLTFHRVVPDFVIQGGCYRGDGNGSATWDGAPLPAELTPRKYVRGSLGMPRNEDPDSGGSQIFVTHRPTPHLDGRYTLFGQLREGFEVLDAIEIGDRILGVRPVEPLP